MSGIQQMLMASHGAGGAPSPFGGLIATTSLVDWWGLDEASGTRVGSHAGLDLTDNNTVTGSAGGGPDGSDASQFTRVNSEYLSRVSSAALQTGNIDFMIAQWIYMDSKPAASYNTLSCKAEYPGQFEWSLDYQTSGDRFRFTVSSDLGTTFGTATANNLGSPSLSTWYLVIGWHDAAGNTVNIQVNNGTVDSTAWTLGVVAGTGAFEVGRTGATLGRHKDGRGQRVGFWKRLLTTDERTALYNSGNGLDY